MEHSGTGIFMWERRWCEILFPLQVLTFASNNFFCVQCFYSCFFYVWVLIGVSRNYISLPKTSAEPLRYFLVIFTFIIRFRSNIKDFTRLHNFLFKTLQEQYHKIQKRRKKVEDLSHNLLTPPHFRFHFFDMMGLSLRQKFSVVWIWMQHKVRFDIRVTLTKFYYWVGKTQEKAWSEENRQVEAFVRSLKMQKSRENFWSICYRHLSYQENKAGTRPHVTSSKSESPHPQNAYMSLWLSDQNRWSEMEADMSKEEKIYLEQKACKKTYVTF